MIIKNKFWNDFLSVEFDKPYFKSLAKFVETSYATKTCYPPKEMIFKALEYCPMDSLKVVILGQDPYHNFGQANGFAFAVPKGGKIPPSLKNILKELKNDLKVQNISSDCINS